MYKVDKAERRSQAWDDFQTEVTNPGSTDGQICKAFEDLALAYSDSTDPGDMKVLSSALVLTLDNSRVTAHRKICALLESSAKR